MLLPDGLPSVTLTGRVVSPLTGDGGTGYVLLEMPAAVADSAGTVLGNAQPYKLLVEDGDYVGSSAVLPNDMAGVVPTGWPYRITVQLDVWQAVFYAPIPSSPSTVTLADLYARSATAPTPGVAYVPLSEVGQPGGVATLGEDGILTAAQRPPAGQPQYGVGAVARDESTLTAYPDSGAITLTAGVYEDYLFTCDSLILPVSGITVRRCKVVASGNFGVRMDANTGEETGRLLEDCEIISAGGPAISGAGFTARRVLVHDSSDDFARIGRSHAEPTVIEDCAVRDCRPAAGAHADGVQVLTQPAADVIIRRCDIAMLTAPGYTRPVDAGYTGAIFIAYDVPVDSGDPEPTRAGRVWVDSCRLQAEDNYVVVVDEQGVDVSRCAIGTGTTAVESINNGVTVTGTANTDLAGQPLTTDIHGDPRDVFLRVGDPRQSGSGGGSTTLAALTDVNVASVADGQLLEYDAGTSTWIPGTPAGGGGSGLVVRSAYITSGTVNLPNTSGAWQVVQQVGGAPFEIDIPAAVGDWVELDVNGMRTGANAVDVAVLVGTSPARYLATGTSTPAGDGDSGWYDSGGGPFALHGGARGFTVTSGDLDAGSVRFCLVTKGTGTGTVLAGPDDTYYWCAKNFGAHS